MVPPPKASPASPMLRRLVFGAAARWAAPRPFFGSAKLHLTVGNKEVWMDPWKTTIEVVDYSGFSWIFTFKLLVFHIYSGS